MHYQYNYNNAKKNSLTLIKTHYASAISLSFIQIFSFYNGRKYIE